MYLHRYRIVLSSRPAMNERRAAAFLRERIQLVCGKRLPMVTDETPPSDYEIVIGKTTREISDGLKIDRAPDRLWEYEIRTVGSRTYLAGLGVPPEPDSSYTTAYKLLNDGAYGTVFAAYRFAEDVLRDPFLFSAYEEPPYLPDVEIAADYRVEYTKAALRAERPEPIEGAALYSVQSSEILNWNMGCTILKTAQGKLIVIDGGHAAEAEHILSVIEQISAPEKPVVSAWFLTHLHEDHYGVFYRICKEPELASRVTVERFCCHLLEKSFYTELSKEASAANAEPLETLLGCENAVGAKLCVLQTGDAVDVDEMVVSVLHVPDMADAKNMNMNDSSVILKLQIAGKQSVLFLADAEWVCSNDLLKNHADQLPSDVVVVGHHGCGSVSRECYEKIGAKLCIWQVGNRFWYSDNGEGLNTHNVGVIRNRCILEECGIRSSRFLRDTNRILALPLPIRI